MSSGPLNIWTWNDSNIPVNGRRVYIVIHFVVKNFSNTPEEISEP
jgi:hypothetical protein